MLRIKIKKALLHLAISATFIAMLLCIIFFIWYPSPFLESSGLKEILLIVLAIDLILGPILTLIVYKPNKPSLKFDISFIVTIQLLALGYGVYTIHQGHPVYVTYTVDRFTIINFKDSALEKIQDPTLQTSGLWKPKFVYVELPTDPKEIDKITFEVLSGKPDVDARPEYYKPFEKYKESVLKGGINPQKLLANSKNQNILNQFLKKHGKKVENYAFLPLSGKDSDVLWVWDISTKSPVSTLAINPWSL